MKTKLTTKLALLFVCTIFVFTSCQLSEEMSINDDGSGKISVKMDGSGFMQMMGGSMFKSGEEVKIDSLFVFKDFLEEYKDSIKTLPEEEKLALKGIEKFSMRILMDSEEGEMNMNMFSNFNSLSELNDVFATFQKASMLAMENDKRISGGNRNGLKDRSGPVPNSNVIYKYNGKMFKRSTEVENYEDFKKEIDSAMAMVKGMFGGSKYKLKYSFPKKIKTSSVEDAMFTGDRKTIIIERDLMDYMANPKIFDFEVKFEN